MFDELPKPGELLFHDFRNLATEKELNLKKTTVRITQWNIERGYQLNKIIQILKELDPDIIALQEVDISCERTECKDIGIIIARELCMNYVFVCEFQEIYSDMRKKEYQGGGVHGNAILTKYNIKKARELDHQYQPFNWERDGHLKGEPRIGKRYTIVTDIETPLGLVSCYGAHFEVFCGMLGRVCQLSEILADARRHALDPTHHKTHQVIVGDLNTMAHSIARFSPKYCNDHMRWKTVGQTESAWFEEKNTFFQCRRWRKKIHI